MKAVVRDVILPASFQRNPRSRRASVVGTHEGMQHPLGEGGLPDRRRRDGSRVHYGERGEATDRSGNTLLVSAGILCAGHRAARDSAVSRVWGPGGIAAWGGQRFQ